MPDLASAIASSMRAERARRKWRQADLAARLDVAQATVSAWESGTREISINLLPRLCEAFGIPLSELVRHADQRDRDLMGM